MHRRRPCVRQCRGGAADGERHHGLPERPGCRGAWTLPRAGWCCGRWLRCRRSSPPRTPRCWPGSMPPTRMTRRVRHLRRVADGDDRYDPAATPGPRCGEMRLLRDHPEMAGALADAEISKSQALAIVEVDEEAARPTCAPRRSRSWSRPPDPARHWMTCGSSPRWRSSSGAPRGPTAMMTGSTTGTCRPAPRSRAPASSAGT